MDAVRKIIENSSPILTIELPKEYENKRLEVIILQLPDVQENNKPNYDFSDLTGKLSWNEDAVEYQKKMRGEWE